MSETIIIYLPAPEQKSGVVGFRAEESLLSPGKYWGLNNQAFSVLDEGFEWFRSKDLALAETRRLRVAKLAALKAEVAKLEALIGTPT